jgi:Zn-dependent alcohol dehydrogenase
MRELTLVEPGRLEWADVDEPRRQDGRDALVRPLAVATCDLDAMIVAGRTPYGPPIAVGHEWRGGGPRGR